MNALLAAAYSYGMVGSIYFAQQYLDLPFEEDAFGKLHAAEKERLQAVAKIAEKCRPAGVEICYDTFYNTLDRQSSEPYFAECLGRFGIPFATTEASVAFLDARQAKYFDHETLMRYFSKGLFLDGEAARLLCERGYEKYLGVRVGEDVLKKRPSLVYDLGALEIITEDFAIAGEGREMWCAHAYCPKGNGSWMEMTVIDEKTEAVTEGRDFRGRPIMPTMTYFENALGGRVCVMSLTVKNNPSQALFNYRRQGLLQRLIASMADEYPFVQGAPDMYVIALMPKAADSDLCGMLTLINLSEDDAENVLLHLPPHLCAAKQILTVARDGSLVPLSAEREENGIRIRGALPGCTPTYIVLKK